MTPRTLRRVAHLDTGREWRGGQAQVLLLMRGLAREGIESLLLAPDAPLRARAQAAGIETRIWNPSGDLDVGAGLQAWGALRAWRPELVHCHTARAHALGVPVARLLGIPVVVSRRVALPIRGGLAGLKYRMPVDRYLCVSRGVRAAMEKGGVPSDRLLVVPSGIEPSASTPLDLRAMLGVGKQAALIATAAALTREKRHEDLLEALPRIRAAGYDAHLVWLGDGPLRPRLEALRDRLDLGGTVHLLGFRDDARALVAQCTIAALASDSEGIATTLIEAQSAGVPVVATAVGGIPEVVVDGVTGRLVAPRDPRALAEAIVGLLGDPTRRAEMAAAARAASVVFHIDRTVKWTLDAYLSTSSASSSAA